MESAPAVRLVNTLIESAYKRNASDIHIEPGKEFLTIRFRIDGDLCMYTKMEVLSPAGGYQAETYGRNGHCRKKTSPGWKVPL